MVSGLAGEAQLAAPDPARWEGRRDRALLALCAQAGLRVAELIGLNSGDVTVGSPTNVRCLGKGRKHRSVPLNTATARLLGTWATERGGRGDEPLFPTRTGRRLSPDAVERIVAKHARTAFSRDHTFPAERIHPHVLRHYVDGWVMWPAVMFAVVGGPRGPVPAT